MSFAGCINSAGINTIIKSVVYISSLICIGIIWIKSSDSTVVRKCIFSRKFNCCARFLIEKNYFMVSASPSTISILIIAKHTPIRSRSKRSMGKSIWMVVRLQQFYIH